MNIDELENIIVSSMPKPKTLKEENEHLIIELIKDFKSGKIDCNFLYKKLYNLYDEKKILDATDYWRDGFFLVSYVVEDQTLTKATKHIFRL